MSDLLTKVLKRCKKDPAFFIDSFIKILHPSLGIIPFRLFKYQRRALKTYTQNRFCVWRKCRQCFVGESKVWTPSGPKRIDSLNKGDSVYSYDLKTSSLVTSEVQELFNNGVRDTVIVETKSGHKARVTPDHEYLTRRGWVQAQCLTQNDIVIEVNDQERYGVGDRSEAILLGYLLSDGYFGRKQIHFTNTRWKYLLEYQKHFELKFGKREQIAPHNRKGTKKAGNKNCYRIYSYSSEAKTWSQELGLCGKVANDKFIPDKIFQWNNDSIAVFLNRLFAGDGWYSGGNCNEAGIGSESILMLHQVKQLLTRFGINAKFYRATTTSMPKLRVIGGKNFNRFVEKIGIFGKEPKKPLTKGFFFNRIKGQVKSVKPSEPAEVFDIRVPPHDNYVVDGAVVHNSGISTLTGVYALWMAMFQRNKTILVVSRSDESAKDFLLRNIKTPYRQLPQFMQDLWPIEENEHRIRFTTTGSTIKSKTSAPDVLRSESASLNIIDEAGFIPKMGEMWTAGWPCTRFNTLVQTDQGLIKIGEIGDNDGDEWQDLNLKVATDEGWQKATKYHKAGKGAPTKILTTKLGFEFESTAHHRIRVIDDSGDYVWRNVGDIRSSDLIVSKPNQFRGSRQLLQNGIELTPDIAEIVGLYVGDGSFSHIRPKRLRINFDPQDVNTRDEMVGKFNAQFSWLPTQAYGDTQKTTEDLRVNSSELSRWWIESGLNSKSVAWDAEIPSPILKSDRAVVYAFLRGLFDSYGWCYWSGHKLHLGLSSASKDLIEQTQVVLHSIGILAHINEEKTTSGRWGDRTQWRLEICDLQNKMEFRDKIGFISLRKQQALNKLNKATGFLKISHPTLVAEFAAEALKIITSGTTFRECQDKRKWNLARIRRSGRIRHQFAEELTEEFGLQSRLANLLREGFVFDSVESLVDSTNDIYDISVPHNNTYIANGLVSHNTMQHGGSAIIISCVTKDTYVFTESGPKRVEKFVDPKQEGGYWIDEYGVLGRDKVRKGVLFCNSGKASTRIVHTRNGSLEGSYNHKLWACVDSQFGWHTLDSLSEGDCVSLQYGMNIWGSNDEIQFAPDPKAKHQINVSKLTPEWGYLIGLYLAEGSTYKKYSKHGHVGTTLTFSCGDDLSNVFSALGLTASCWDGLHWSVSSKNLGWLFESVGIDLSWHAPDKKIPDRLLECSPEIIISIVRGIMDGDGSSRSDRGNVQIGVTSKELRDQLSILFNNFGIVSNHYRRDKDVMTQALLKSGKANAQKHNHDIWVLELDKYNSNTYYSLIGFGFERKQENHSCVNHVLVSGDSNDLVPFSLDFAHEMFDAAPFGCWTFQKRFGLNLNPIVSKKTRYKTEHLARKTLLKLYSITKQFLTPDRQEFFDRILSPNLRWIKIQKIETGEAEVYDFSLPDEENDFWDHSVIYNGFLGHQTPAGIGNWYWQTFDDSLKGENDFTPIEIDWWDMDWELEWIDETSGDPRRIAPCDDIEPVTDPDERDLLGPYKSPWLIDQYRALQAKGEAHRFHQEVLARFIGSGNTVLRSRVLTFIRENTSKDYQTVSTVDYANPINGERDILDFRDQLRVWEQPIRANQCPNCRQIVKPDQGGFFSTMKRARNVPICPHCLEQDLNIAVPLVDHIYVMGVDVSSGEANDFSAIQIFDCYKRKQVAELKIKVLPKDLCKMADFLGRYYNNAYMVVERTGIGIPVCQELNLEYCYPNLYRQKVGDGEVYNKKKKYGNVGFPTSATGKPKLIKCLINEVTDEVDEAGDAMGVYIASDRLCSELMTFIYVSEKKIGAEEGNHDDLVMACTLALLGLEEAIAHDMSGIAPMHYDIAPGRRSIKGDLKTQISRFTEYGGKSVLPPIINTSEGQKSSHDRATMEMVDFMRQMVGGVNGEAQSESKDIPAVVSRRHVVQGRIKPKAR